jgi:transcription elongation factor GreA
MSERSASELMRELGLLVDGPVVWGRPVPERTAGIFVIELTRPQAEAPIDFAAVAGWLERVPALTVDGGRPTTNALARRLAEFWLPDEQIVYVGRSRRAIGARIAALYATPLGDDRPNAHGHWLKTLLQLSHARIWWAATDAQEEYEDELLNRIADRQELADGLGRTLGLPFANLVRTTGEAKAHGLAGSLREPSTADATPASPVAARSRPTKRPAARRTAPGRTPAPAAPPRPAPAMLSAAGADDLATELEHLRSRVRPGVIERVKAARELGDLRENSEYESARKEQSFVEGRIQTLEALLRTAVVVEGSEDGAAAVGSAVVVEIDGETSTWWLVGSTEADPASGRISYVSPVGRALLGRRAGDEVIAQLPRGQLQIRLIEVR